MKTRCLMALSIAGMVLLAGNLLGERAFGSGLRWKKPANGEAAVQSVTHIPTVITTDDSVDFLDILQVQYDEPAEPVQQLPRITVSVSTDDVPLRETRQEMQPEMHQPLVPCTDQSSLLKSIKDISHDIRPSSTSDATPVVLPEECALEGQAFYGRHFGRTNFMWKASAVSTKAAYFEDTQLERHGHTKVCPALQPVVSGARFFATIPILPYKMGVTPPKECVYTLGHIRSGNCAPYMAEPFPISPRGALFQAGAVTGAVFAIP